MKIKEYQTGTKEFWFGEYLHREDGPAVEYATGINHWWNKGKRHNTFGPAVTTPHKTEMWFFNGEQKTNEVKRWLITNEVHWKEMDEADFHMMWFDILRNKE